MTKLEVAALDQRNTASVAGDLARQRDAGGARADDADIRGDGGGVQSACIMKCHVVVPRFVAANAL